MGRVLGIAGSSRPEVDGVFLCRDEGEVDFFCRMNADRGPVDIWAVEGISNADLVEAPEGFAYLPTPIPAEQLTLWRRTRQPEPDPDTNTTTSAYQSTLTITLTDGRVLRDTEAREWAQGRPRTDR